MIQIKGTITLSDGSTSEFLLATDSSYQQWGADTERLGRTVDLLQAMHGVLQDAYVEGIDGEWSYDKDGDTYDAPCPVCGAGPIDLKGHGGVCPNGHILEGI